MSIRKEYLTFLKECVYKLDKEICGILVSEKDIENKNLDKFFETKHALVPFFQSIGQAQECEYNYYSKYIFHTHVIKYGKGYPSETDFLKPIYNKEIINSLVFTPWGVWEIYSSPELKLDKLTDKNKIQNYSMQIKNLIDELYQKTKKGRIKELESSHIKEIWTCIVLIKKILDLDPDKKDLYDIHFTTWKHIETKENYIYNLVFNK